MPHLQGVPCEFATYLNYCRSLRFEEKPDYRSVWGRLVVAGEKRKRPSNIGMKFRWYSISLMMID